MGASTGLVAIRGGYTDLTERVLSISAGGNIDIILMAQLEIIRNEILAGLLRGRMITVVIPSGTYVMSSTTATITLEPWMRIKTGGNVRIANNGHSVPFFELRNDIGSTTTPTYNGNATTQIQQGSESENNNGVVIDGSNGILMVESNLTAGGALLRLGNGDGTWGANYTGTTAFFVAMAKFVGVFGTGLDHGLQFTNNGSFSTRWENIRLTTCNKNIVTSAAAVGLNAFEQHTFNECFFNNTNTTHIEWNGGLGDGSSSHQFSFVHSSLTYCAGDVLTINTASTCRFEMVQGRLENFTRIAYGSVASPNSLVSLNEVMIIPTNTIGPNLVPHLRKYFVGTFQLQLLGPKYSMNGANTWSTLAYNDAATQFMCDDTVTVQCSNVAAAYSAGTTATNSNMRCLPITKLAAARNRNPSFEEAGTGGWATSGGATFARTTVAGEFYVGTAGLSVDCVAQYGVLTSERIPVSAGMRYYADLVCRVRDTSTTNLLAITPTVTWYAWDAATVISTTTVAQSATYQNWYNRRHATQWHRHPTGTGNMEAPAGACFAVIAWNFSASTSITTVCTATFYVDNVVFIEL